MLYIVIYKLDKDYNLLDEHDHYLQTKEGTNIQLTPNHLDKLR